MTDNYISTDAIPDRHSNSKTYISASSLPPAPTAASAVVPIRDGFPEEQLAMHDAALVPAEPGEHDPVEYSHSYSAIFSCHGIASQDAIVPGSAARHVPFADLR
jgi:hypothetical protein